MRPFNVFAVTVIAAGLILTACKSTGPKEAGSGHTNATLLWESTQCAETEPGARWIGNQKALDAVVAAALRSQVGTNTPATPSVDFESRRVVLVTLGRQSTAGYGIDLPADAYRLEDNRARLEIIVLRPAKGSFQAQVITSPCALVSLPKEAYSELRVFDQAGQRFAALSIE